MANKTQEAANHQRTNNITELPDNCLEFIFHSLDPLDLLNLAETEEHLDLPNRRLTPQAGRLFFQDCHSRRVFIYMILFSSGCSPIKYTDDSIEINEKVQASQVVRCFGHLISDLLIDFDGSESFDDLVDDTFRCCSESLTSLSLREITKRMLTGDEVVFKNVQRVSIIGGKLGQGLKLNRLFPQMRWLELCPEEVTDPDSIEVSFPHLVYLKIRAYAFIQSRITRRNLMVVIDLNPQLRRLNLLSGCDPNTWKHVSTQLKQLEALEIVYSPTQVHKYTDVIQFESVQQLTISIINSDLERYNTERATILTFNRLKECTLKGRVNDVWYQFVLENSTIEKLTIVSENDCLCIDQRLLQIVNKLTKLTEISIDGCRFSVEKVNQFLEKGNHLTKVHLSGKMKVIEADDPEEEKHKWKLTEGNWKLTTLPTLYDSAVLLEKQ